MAVGTIPLSQFRTTVRGLIGDASYDLTLVDQAINWFINEIHLNNRIRYMEAEDDLYPSAGDTDAELPDDFQTLLTMTLTSPQVADLTRSYVAYADFMKDYPGFKTYTAKQIQEWTDFANGIRFSAPVSASSIIHVDYLRSSVPMVDATDTTDIPDAYEELVSKGALARLMEINEDYEEAAQERENLAPQLTTFIRNEGRGGIKVGPNVIRSNRGRGRGGNNWSARDM